MTQEIPVRKNTGVSFFNYDLKQITETKDPQSSKEQNSTVT